MRSVNNLVLVIILLTVSAFAYSEARDIVIRKLLDEVTTTSTSSTTQVLGSKRTFQFFGATSSGAGASIATIQVSNDDLNWITKDTLSITLSVTSSSDSYEMDAPWKYTRGVVESISGTGATVSLISGEESRFK